MTERDQQSVPHVLDDDTRDALHDELFSRWDAMEPDKFHCFIGSDGDLVDAVNDARDLADQESEPGDDR